MKKIMTVLVGLLLSMTAYSSEVENLTIERGPGSEFAPTIETCDLLEDDSFYSNMHVFKNTLLNDSESFCTSFSANNQYPCSFTLLNQKQVFDFKYHPKLLASFAYIMEYEFVDHEDIPVPNTKKPINLSSTNLKVLSYLCTRSFLEEMEAKPTPSDSVNMKMPRIFLLSSQKKAY